jgi:hypothetical protein
MSASRDNDFSNLNLELCLPWPECLHGTDHPETNGTPFVLLELTHIGGKSRVQERGAAGNAKGPLRNL